MAAPRLFEMADGHVEDLVPLLSDLRAVQSRQIDLATYRGRYLAVVERIFSRGRLAPGELTAADGQVIVGDGDTLCCSCSREAAAAGRCHRVWSSALLIRAGWRVILDGRVLVGVDADWRPLYSEDSEA